MMRRAVLLVAFAALPDISTAQSAPPPMIGIGRVHEAHSSTLGETRRYFVYEPPGLRGRPLPLVVVLDGDANFLHTATTARFLAESGRIPPVRVVGLGNTVSRTRDFTPPVLGPAESQLRDAGGASRFLDYIANEVIPAVEKDYGSAPLRILVGHSLGGLTAAHAMLTQGDLFRALVMISPSLWFDRYRLADSLIARARTTTDTPWIYGTVGGREDPVQTVPFRRVLDSLTVHPSRWWHWRVLETEDHGSTPLRTTYEALETLFADMRIPAGASRALGIDGIDRWYADLKTRFRYPDHTPEAALNTLGYEWLADSTAGGRVNALRAFRENTRRFASSANTYDSLGDALARNGDRGGAAACYAKAMYLGKTQPDGGETFANAQLVPGASSKFAAIAGEDAARAGNDVLRERATACS